MTHPNDALRLVPAEPTREQELAMQRALLDNYPVVLDGEVCTNGNILHAIYSAALAAAPASPLPGKVIEPGQMTYDQERGFTFTGWRVEIGDQGPKAGILAILNYLREEADKVSEEEISDAYSCQANASPLPEGGGVRRIKSELDFIKDIAANVQRDLAELEDGFSKSQRTSKTDRAVAKMRERCAALIQCAEDALSALPAAPTGEPK